MSKTKPLSTAKNVSVGSNDGSVHSSGLLSVHPEFSGKIRASRSEAWRIVREREVATVKIGRRVFVPLGAVQDYIAKRTTPPFDPNSAA